MKQTTKIKLFSALTLYSLAAIANAANWVETNGVYIDTDSFKRHGDSTEFWVMTPYSKSKILKVGKYQADQTRELIEIKCRESLMRQVYFVAYYRSELVTSRASSMQFTPIIPDSLGDSLYRAVCKN